MSTHPRITNIFSLFEIDARFDIDLDELDHKYYDLQRQFHPDNSLSKPDEEKFAALNKSMEINDAYKILKSHVERATHILELNGIEMEAVETKPDMNMLAEIMQKRQAVETATTKEELNKLHDEIEAERKAGIADLLQKFNENDLEEATRIVIKQKYLKRLEIEIDNRKRA